MDALIPWLLQEDAQLHGIPFSEVIFDVTGKRVLTFNPKNESDLGMVKQVSVVLDEVMSQLNSPASVIQGIPSRDQRENGGVMECCNNGAAMTEAAISINPSS